MLRNFHNQDFHSTLYFLLSPSGFLLFFLTLKYLAHLEFISVWSMNLTLFFPETISSLSQHVLRLILPFLIDLKRHPYTCTPSHVLLWRFLWPRVMMGDGDTCWGNSLASQSCCSFRLLLFMRWNSGIHTHSCNVDWHFVIFAKSYDSLI